MRTKNIILFMALFAGVIQANAQTYSPSSHTGLNLPIGLSNMPDGARTYFKDAVNFTYRPFVNTAEVLSYFNTTAKRRGHVAIIVNTGGSLSSGVITGGVNDAYWFKNGYTDGDLVRVVPDLSIYLLKIDSFGTQGYASRGRAQKIADSLGRITDTTRAGMDARKPNTSALAAIAFNPDYSNLTNTPSLNAGVYFAPGQSFNPSFVVFASAIVRPQNSFTHGSPIVWELLEHSTGHNSSFYDTAYGGVDQRLYVHYPKVKNVLNSTITPDETFAQNNVFVGPSVGDSTFGANVTRTTPMNITLTGNGSTTWTKNQANGSGSLFTISTFSTGDGITKVGYLPTYAADNNAIGLQYIGPNGYQIKRVYSGLGSYDMGFVLLDNFGNAVTDAPTSNDNVVLQNFGMQTMQLPMATYQSFANDFMGTFTNFWVFGSFECWMVAAPVSTVSIQVRWQIVYPSATTYKIYRSASKYGTYALIHTGTEGVFVDGSLTTGTSYYYKLFGVVGGVDTYISSFVTNTL